MTDIDKRLELLRSVPPLLDDCLPSPPGSPRLSATLRGKLVFDAPDEQLPSRQDWKLRFPPTRLQQLAAAYRQAGRQVKHKGDALFRKNQQLSLAYQTDAVCLYTFAFWCDDAAKRTCLRTNWTSMFGLLTYIQRAAEKLGEHGKLIIAVCARLEAIVVLTLYEAEQKVLAQKGAQATSSAPSPTSLNASTNGNALSLSTAAGSPSSASADNATGQQSQATAATVDVELVRSFTKASHEFFRAIKLLNAATSDHLCPAYLSRHLPATWSTCVNNAMNCSEPVQVPEKPFRFAWPVEGRGIGGQGVPSVVAFCRAVIDEHMTLTHKKDWTLETVVEQS